MRVGLNDNNIDTSFILLLRDLYLNGPLRTATSWLVPLHQRHALGDIHLCYLWQVIVMYKSKSTIEIELHCLSCLV